MRSIRDRNNTRSQTPQPPQPPPTLNDIISEFRRAAITDTQFLGHPDALRRKTWIGSERGKRILVDRRQPDEPAIFWLIGEISDEGFWLYPDGGLNARLAPTTLTSHHATAFLTRPQNERLGRLFDAALTTAAQSESLKRNPEVLTRDHLVRTLPRNDKRYLRIKHRILTIPESDDDVVPRERVSTTSSEKERIVAAKWKKIDDKWTLEDLPCRTEYSFNEHDKLIRNNKYGYKWNLLPAYNEEELPIAPNRYESKLRGATVLCYISLCRWEIENKYSFSPHIVQLRVLIPPVPQTSTPRTPSRMPRSPLRR
ncbi:hypothetical protein VKT23_001338 [Stygiomarasmius scandens]|uniref:Uncharacterized protein n=1 Tax=Marasmiellus scandens TaxID=2682957 RepID=A0ABR1K9Z5_9AGAR